MAKEQRKIECKGTKLYIEHTDRVSREMSTFEFDAGTVAKAKKLSKIVNTPGCGAYYDKVTNTCYTFLVADGGHKTLNRVLADL